MCGLGGDRALVASPTRFSIGVGLAISKIKALSAVLVFGFGAGAASAQQTSPSDVSFTPLDILWETEGTRASLVVRYLVPEIARDTGTVGYDAVAQEMDHLCEQVAVTTILNTESKIDQILVVLLDRPIPRGEPVPEATQFINVYSLQDNRCIWEDF